MPRSFLRNLRSLSGSKGDRREKDRGMRAFVILDIAVLREQRGSWSLLFPFLRMVYRHQYMLLPRTEDTVVWDTEYPEGARP